MKVTYPLKEITDDNVKDKLGSTNKYGKYPIGIHNAWHGGLHLEGSAKELQAVADGRIIAYRLDKEEKETSIDIEIDKEQKYNYSSSFILMQHDYKSPEGLEMTFYSVYHHLLSKTGMAKLKLPTFLTKTESKVKKGLQQKIHGLQARAKASYATVKFVIPKDAIVTLDDSDTLDTHWSRTSHKASQYKKVYYTDLHDTTHYDIYIPTSSKYVTVDTNNNQALTITTANNGKIKVKRVEKGEHLRETGSTTGTIITVVKPEIEVTVLEASKGSYTKVKYTQENGIEQEGYIYSESLEKKETFDKEILDKIQISDLKIKAGQHIGYIGKYGIEKKHNYIAAHLEIFTTDNIKDFLENTKKDGEDKKHFAKIPKGTTLKANLIIDVDIKENTPLKVLKIEGDYAQVKIKALTQTLVNDVDITYHKKPNKHYTIIASQFEKVNEKFNCTLDLDTIFEYENVKPETTWKDKTNLNRIITHKTQDTGKKYWIVKKDLAKTVINEGCDDMYTQIAKAGDTTKTNKAITKAYIEPPTTKATKDEIVNKEHITNISKFKKVKESEEKVWYKAEFTYTIDKKEETKKGWLLEKDIKDGLFSAYQWEQFGFQHLNAGSEFVYSLADIEKQDITKAVEEEKISKFVKTVWDIIDVDKTNKKLSPLELEIAFEDSKKMEILSKLVCTHKCEWAYDIATIKSEAAELYDIALGNNPSDTLKKQKESRILALENRMTELMFWNDASGEYKGEVDTKLPARKFPSKDMVHYFHPMAWVKQMKLILGNGGDHGDYHDPVINPQVRGWYNSGSTFNKSSNIGGWNPYASMRIHKHKEDNKDQNVREYGKPQRSTGGHGGLDIYAPVGTPIYACVDGVINHHKMVGAKAGFLTQLKGKYKGKTYIFQYLHLMEIESDRFRFYNNYGNKNVPNDGWLNYSDLSNELTDPLVGEKYKISYNSSQLQIDDNIIDIDLAVSISKKKVKKGDLIGYTGSTGNSYQGKKKNHLHFGIKDAKDNRLSPYELFEDYINLDESGIETSSKQDGVNSSEKW